MYKLELGLDMMQQNWLCVQWKDTQWL